MAHFHLLRYLLTVIKIDPRNPQNDPRPIPNFLSRFDNLHPHRRAFHDSDSDPEEPDIEEHFAQGPPGFFSRRNIYRSPEQPSAENTARASPDDGESIIRRFTEMLGDIGGGGGGPPPARRSGPDTLFSDQGGGAPQFTYRRISGPGFSGGVSSVTITTGPAGGRIRHSGSGQGPPGDDDFSRYSLLLIFYVT